MSIASELSALNGHIISAYDEISTMGGTIPANKNMANLPTAIASIPTGGGGDSPKIECGLFTVPTDTDLNTNSTSIEIASITLTSVYIAGLVLNGTLNAGLRNFASSIHVDPSALGLSVSTFGRVSASCSSSSSALNGNLTTGGSAISIFSGLYVSGGKLIYNVKQASAQAKFLASRTYTWFVVGK